MKVVRCHGDVRSKMIPKPNKPIKETITKILRYIPARKLQDKEDPQLHPANMKIFQTSETR